MCRSNYSIFCLIFNCNQVVIFSRFSKTLMTDCFLLWISKRNFKTLKQIPELCLFYFFVNLSFFRNIWFFLSLNIATELFYNKPFDSHHMWYPKILLLNWQTHLLKKFEIRLPVFQPFHFQLLELKKILLEGIFPWNNFELGKWNNFELVFHKKWFQVAAIEKKWEKKYLRQPINLFLLTTTESLL